MSEGWRPLIEGGAGEGDRVRRAVDRIAEQAAGRLTAAPSANLSSGDPGLALLFAYLSRADHGDIERAAELARAFLERAADALASEAASPWLFGGWLGAVFVAEHLQGALYGPEVDLAGELVPALETLVARPDAHFDLSFGTAGVLVVAAERARQRRDAVVDRILERGVEGLRASATGGEPGRTWRTRPTPLLPTASGLYPEGFFDVGVAHGVPGVIGALARCHARGIDGAGELARDAVAWLAAQEQGPSVGSAYGTFFVPGEPPRTSRLAWCYGDAGVAGVLAAAARALDETEIAALATRIGHRAAARTPADSGVEDPGLCHGSAGLLLVFHRLWCATGDPVFAAAARGWLASTLDGLERLERDGGALPEVGLLRGLAGTALALEAAISSQAPDWDAFLLLSP